MMDIDKRVFYIDMSYRLHQSFVLSFYRVHVFVSFYQLNFFFLESIKIFPVTESSTYSTSAETF